MISITLFKSVDQILEYSTGFKITQTRPKPDLEHADLLRNFGPVILKMIADPEQSYLRFQAERINTKGNKKNKLFFLPFIYDLTIVFIYFYIFSTFGPGLWVSISEGRRHLWALYIKFHEY
jgi:hypothetical protein